MSVVPPLRGTPLYRYIPGVGRALAQDLTVAKYSTFGGNVLVVDQVYGNDVLAAEDPFNRPFLTLQGALNKVASGQSIYLMPGAYQGPITIPANTDTSVEFTPADTFDIRVTTGEQNMNNYSFVSTLGFY